MSKLIGRLFLLLVGACGVVHESSAATYLRRTGIEMQADDAAILIMFVNGIKNDKNKVAASTETLIESLKTSGLPQSTYTIASYYNPTDGFLGLGDTGEVAYQQRVSNAYLSVSGGNLTKYYSLLGADYNDKVANVGSLAGAEKRVVSVVGQLKRNIVYSLTADSSHVASKGMVLVPHSQGNLYAEAVYAMLVADGNTAVLSRLRIVGVAVASATTPSNRYITHDSDTIVGSASAEVVLAISQLLSFRPLSANAIACSKVLGSPFCGTSPLWAAIDGTEHGFTDVYLNPVVTSQATSEAFPKIVYDLVAASLADLEKPPVAAAGRFAYVAHANNGSTAVNGISAYTINANTGGLMSVTGNPFPAGAWPLSVAVHPSGKFAYATDSNSSSLNNIYAYAINTSTGALTPANGSPFAAGWFPNSVTLEPSGKFAYVVVTGGVYAYAVNSSSGALTAVTGSPFGSPYISGSASTIITSDPSGKFLYAVDDVTRTISAYAITATGALTNIGSPLAAGITTAAMTVDPSGNFVYVVSYGARLALSEIYAYAINTSTGALTPANGSPFDAGAIPTGIAIDPSGKFVYVTNSVSNNILAYTINSSTGALTPLTSGASTATIAPYAIAIDPSGKFAYVANWASTTGNIAVYSINSGTGALTAVTGGSFATGLSPRAIAISK